MLKFGYRILTVLIYYLISSPFHGELYRIDIVSPANLPNNLTAGKIRLSNSIIRNPILVSYASKGILPYRGLCSGIKRALDTWPEIDYSIDFIHLKYPIFSGIVHLY